MFILNDPLVGDQPKIELETKGESEVFGYLTPYIEKAGFNWIQTSKGDGVSTVIISSYPLRK